MNTPAHQAAGPGSGLGQRLQPATRSTELLRWDLEHKVSISFQVHLPSSCRFSELEGLYLVTASRLSPQAAAGKSPSDSHSLHSLLTLISPNQCQRNTKSHPHFHNASILLYTHSSITWGKDTKNLSSLRDSIFNSTPLPTASVDHLFLLKQKVLFQKCFYDRCLFTAGDCSPRTREPKMSLVTKKRGPAPEPEHIIPKWNVEKQLVLPRFESPVFHESLKHFKNAVTECKVSDFAT